MSSIYNLYNRLSYVNSILSSISSNSSNIVITNQENNFTETNYFPLINVDGRINLNPPLLQTITASISGTCSVYTLSGSGILKQYILVFNNATGTVIFTLPFTPTYVLFKDIIGAINTDGLRQYLVASDPTSYSGSGTTWVNLGGIGTSSNATLVGSPIYTTDPSGNIPNNLSYFSFSATKYAIFSRNTTNTTDSFSWGIWFRTTQVGAGTLGNPWYTGSVILGGFVAGQRCYGISMMAGGYIVFGRDSGTNIINVITTSGNYNDGRWHYIFCTRDRGASRMSIFMDGINQPVFNTGIGTIRFDLNPNYTIGIETTLNPATQFIGGHIFQLENTVIIGGNSITIPNCNDFNGFMLVDAV
jgi:hypothetical protein